MYNRAPRQESIGSPIEPAIASTHRRAEHLRVWWSGMTRFVVGSFLLALVESMDFATYTATHRVDAGVVVVRPHRGGRFCRAPPHVATSLGSRTGESAEVAQAALFLLSCVPYPRPRAQGRWGRYVPIDGSMQRKEFSRRPGQRHGGRKRRGEDRWPAITHKRRLRWFSSDGP